MKLVQCIIRPEKCNDVVEALQTVCSGMTVFESRGHGRQKGHSTTYRGVEYSVSLLPKVVIDVVAPDNRVDDIVEVLLKTARTGDIGDGRIFIYPVDEAYHVRTGFMDLD